MKCKFCGNETEHEEEDICHKCLSEKLGEEIEKHPLIKIDITTQKEMSLLKLKAKTIDYWLNSYTIEHLQEMGLWLRLDDALPFEMKLEEIKNHIKKSPIIVDSQVYDWYIKLEKIIENP